MDDTKENIMSAKSWRHQLGVACLAGALLFAPVSAVADLDTLRWKPENHAALSRLIDAHRHQGHYAVFDWDYTSIYQDTQENLFRYQIDNLRFKATPAEFAAAIRKDIPNDDFADAYRNVDGRKINIQQIAADLDARYAFLYANYIGERKMSLAQIQQTEEFKDFRGKLAFLYEAIGGSFSHDVSYPWVLYLFTGMSRQEVMDLAKEANDFALGQALGKYRWTSSATLTGRTGQVSHEYKSGLRVHSEMANLFHELQQNGIEVYVITASLEDVVRVFATDPSYGYRLKPENIYGMRLHMNGDIYQGRYRSDYPQTQTHGKVAIIEGYLKPRHGGKAPILVAGDSSGDENMLTAYADTRLLLLMKREGRLDKVAEDRRALIQTRNLQTGLFNP